MANVPKSLLQNVPCATDMEQGITLAIEETPLKHIGCYRHLNGDLKAWVKKHGGNSDDQKVYCDHVFALLKCTTRDGYNEQLADFTLLYNCMNVYD